MGNNRYRDLKFQENLYSSNEIKSFFALHFSQTTFIRDYDI